MGILAKFVSRSSAVLALAVCIMLSAAPAAARDGRHDFDFEYGTWHAHLARLLHPLSHSHVWTHYSGSSVVRALLDGGANAGELDVRGPLGRIRGMTLRMYNPQSQRWSIYWASANDGVLTAPLIGAFRNRQGTFFNTDTFNGRPIVARFVFSRITRRAFHLTQSFSSDAGKTWETNWISDFTR